MRRFDTSTATPPAVPRTAPTATILRVGVPSSDGPEEVFAVWIFDARVFAVWIFDDAEVARRTRRRAASRRASAYARVASWRPTPADPVPKIFAALTRVPPVLTATSRNCADFVVLVMPPLFHILCGHIRPSATGRRVRGGTMVG